MTGGAPTRLRVEQLIDPLGIDVRRPRLSWWLPDGAARQIAFHVRCDRWDSGWVQSAESVLVEYGGPPLRSTDCVQWRVRVRTDLGESDWSAPAAFELGLLEPGDWSAHWIGPAETTVPPPAQRPAYRLRGDFDLAAAGPARLYATAHGIYEVFLNGTRVGDAELTPGYTAYGARLQVQTYDVGSLLRDGDNTIEALVSDGWFRGQVGLPRAHDQWGDALAFLAELRVDGRVVCVTDASWRSGLSEVTRADLIGGQTTDLGIEMADWSPVVLPELRFDHLVASPSPPVRATASVVPVAVYWTTTGQVVDLGQNISGRVRLGRLGPAGTSLALVHGEALGGDGELTTDHLRVDLPFLAAPLPAGQVDRVVSAGRDGDVFEPRHTTHGFRYVRIEGHPEALTPADVTGVAVHTDLERTGWFHCSDERINRLHEAAVWSFRGNACDVPTDCPTRERAAWTGDWQLFVPTAAFLYDVAGFSRKWLRDLAAEQTPEGLVANQAPSPPHESPSGPLGAMNGSAGWGDAAVIVPWELYRAYGDTRILAEQWDSMVAWVEWVARAAPDGLWDSGFHFGEWLEPGVDLKGPEEFAAFRAASKADVATAYFARSAELLGRIATVLRREQDAARYAAIADKARRAWQAACIGPDARLAPDTQANHVRALAFDLVPGELRAATTERLVELIRAAGTHLGTGFLATPYLLPVLADAGHLDVAYELLFRDSMPSWLYMIDRGATTVWERWDGIRADGTPYESLNHYSKGAVISFLHRYVAGLQLLDDSPAYRRFRVAPRPGGGITSAQARHDSSYGAIEVDWRIARGRFELTVEVPPGTTALVVLPDGVRHEAGPGRHAWS